MTRTRCPRCERPLSSCLCGLVEPVSNQVQVLVLQHPSEQMHAKGTARLLQLCLQHCELRVGEQFDRAVDAGGRYTMLLFPGSDDPQLTHPPELDSAQLAEPARLRLIVLDGTWRKSRKLLYQNPWLQRLPRLPLLDAPASTYRIRRAHAEHQLSTLEAVACALQQLEGRLDHWQPLWRACHAFVERERALRPP